MLYDGVVGHSINWVWLVGIVPILGLLLLLVDGLVNDTCRVLPIHHLRGKKARLGMRHLLRSVGIPV